MTGILTLAVSPPYSWVMQLVVWEPVTLRGLSARGPTQQAALLWAWDLMSFVIYIEAIADN